MGRLGFEPRTNRLKAECSTAELATLGVAVIAARRPVPTPYTTVTQDLNK
jgi:hypothetical protein